RAARRAQTEFARRHKHERLAGRREASAANEMTWPEVQQVLHEELNGLSERHRAPLTLHYLQGKTLDESAAQLGLSKRTLKTRLRRCWPSRGWAWGGSRTRCRPIPPPSRRPPSRSRAATYLSPRTGRSPAHGASSSRPRRRCR